MTRPVRSAARSHRAPRQRPPSSGWMPVLTGGTCLFCIGVLIGLLVGLVLGSGAPEPAATAVSEVRRPGATSGRPGGAAPRGPEASVRPPVTWSPGPLPARLPRPWWDDALSTPGTVTAPARPPTPVWPVPPAPVVAPQPQPQPEPEPQAVRSTRLPDDSRPSRLVDLPAWRRYAVPVVMSAGQPRVAVVLDDLGLDPERVRWVIGLPGPLTLAFLPYAAGLPQQTKAARAAGHELLVHVPMEPVSPEHDPGPGALYTHLAAAQIRDRLTTALARFDGYVGINNHMGSRFTADAAGMALVLDEVAARGLLFLDSLTTGASVASGLSAHRAVPLVRRDVFLDTDATPAAIRLRLAELEQVARSRGRAVGIGHPYDSTLAVLAEWLSRLAARGLTLVPISAIAASGLAKARSTAGHHGSGLTDSSNPL